MEKVFAELLNQQEIQKLTVRHAAPVYTVRTCQVA